MQKVIQALRGRKSVVIDGTRLALEISSELLGLAPVPGLQEAAKTLLGIWDAVNKIEVSCNLLLVSSKTELTGTNRPTVLHACVLLSVVQMS